MRRKYKRVGFTAMQKAELWDRWQKGEGLKSIGRAFGKSSSSIYSHVSPFGGIRPPERRRSRLSLTLAEREEISRGIVAQCSIRSIARSLGRAASTVSREISRNGDLAIIGIGQRQRINAPGARRYGRSRVSWRDAHA